MMVEPNSLTALRPDSFRPDAESSDAGHARSFEETWDLLEPLLPRVPVTRVYDTTPLDYISSPVWSAVTPLAEDLMVSAGKGATPIAAKLSAVMEAIERVSAEELPARRIVRGSYADLAPAGAVDPADFNLPLDTAYRPDAVFSWTGAYDLARGGHHLVPADLVLNPATEGMTARIETNGLASGNTYSEAVLHAVCELVERDAVSEEAFYSAHHDPLFSPRRPLRVVSPESVPAGAAKDLLDALTGQQLVVRIQDLTNVIGVPVIRVVLFDDGYFGQEGKVTYFPGYGADLRPERALLRALTEACQGHASFATGAREVFETGRAGRRPAEMKRIDSLYRNPGSLPFPRAEDAGGSILENLRTIVGRLRDAGHDRCLVTELTRADLGVPVVRVLVPGLASPYGESSRTPTLRLLESVI
ncbi:YcaO-like family protein [Streptomyces sp. NPDC093084]|uniref:YcaO-like family protein n=1 Tax=Streptomyces sp. NPDC093084 TaxID=3155197 RepID=UPI003442EEC5